MKTVKEWSIRAASLLKKIGSRSPKCMISCCAASELTQLTMILLSVQFTRTHEEINIIIIIIIIIIEGMAP